MVAKLYIGTPSHHIALSFKIWPKFLFRPSPRRATTGTRTELGSLLTCNVVQKQIKTKEKNAVPKKYVLLNSVWLDGEAEDFKHFYKLKSFGQLRYWVILLNTSHLNPELSKLSRFAAPAQNSTAPLKVSVGNSSHPFPTLPDAALPWPLRLRPRCLRAATPSRCASWPPPAPAAPRQARDSAPQLQRVCRSCRARDGYH